MLTIAGRTLDVPEYSSASDKGSGPRGEASTDSESMPPLTVDTAASPHGSFTKRRVAVALMSVAAALLVVVGVGSILRQQGSTRSGSVVASAALKPIDAPAGSGGSIRAVTHAGTGSLTVRTSALVQPTGRHYYEVWLLNPSTKKMLPVGVLPPSGASKYTMPSSIMRGYSAVDISLQANNGNPAHSTVSVL